jgi:hypothetical protein
MIKDKLQKKYTVNYVAVKEIEMLKQRKKGSTSNIDISK